MKVADSLYTSKIRYGIQLLGKVRTTAEDPINFESQITGSNYNSINLSLYHGLNQGPSDPEADKPMYHLLGKI